MVVTTVFFGLTTTAVSEKRLPSEPNLGTHLVAHSQHLAIGLRRAVGTVLETPPGVAIHLTTGPPFPKDGIAGLLIFHLQGTVTDIIVVLPAQILPHRLWSLTIHANRSIECITSTGEILGCASLPR